MLRLDHGHQFQSRTLSHLKTFDQQVQIYALQLCFCRLCRCCWSSSLWHVVMSGFLPRHLASCSWWWIVPGTFAFTNMFILPVFQNTFVLKWNVSGPRTCLLEMALLMCSECSALVCCTGLLWWNPSWHFTPCYHDSCLDIWPRAHDGGLCNVHLHSQTCSYCQYSKTPLSWNGMCQGRGHIY